MQCIAHGERIASQVLPVDLDQVEGSNDGLPSSPQATASPSMM
jgi:hypothetical protein